MRLMKVSCVTRPSIATVTAEALTSIAETTLANVTAFVGHVPPSAPNTRPLREDPVRNPAILATLALAELLVDAGAREKRPRVEREKDIHATVLREVAQLDVLVRLERPAGLVKLFPHLRARDP